MKKIKLITLIVVITAMMFILSGCTSVAETERQFTLIRDEGTFCIYYHNKTKVMYIMSDGYYNSGTATVMLDAEGKPLLYEGE